MLCRSAVHHQARLLRSTSGSSVNDGRRAIFLGSRIHVGIATPLNCKLVVVRWNFATRRIDKLNWLRQQTTATTTTNVVSNNAPSPSNKRPWWDRFKRFAKALRYARIITGVFAVYGLGYQQGVINCSRTPRLMEDELLQTILADVGVKSKDQIKVFSSEDRLLFAMSPEDQMQTKIVKCGNDIVRAASLHVREELTKAIRKVEDQLSLATTKEEALKIIEANEDVQFWKHAAYRVEGEGLKVPWKYILVDSPIANAFVSEILPQRFFITTSMFKNFIDNEDELAVVLGHEMAHLVLGHVSRRNSVETTLRAVEVLLLAIDPTEGMIGMGVIGGLAWLRGILMASFSRENESEADELGLRFAAMACYDTKNGACVMKKMHDYQVSLKGKPSNNSHLLQLLDTHPPSLDRYNRILKQSETENPDKYAHTHCVTVHRRMVQAVWGKGS